MTTRKNTRQAKYLVAKADTLRKKGNYEEALEVINLALEYDPTLTSALKCKQLITQYKEINESKAVGVRKEEATYKVIPIAPKTRFEVSPLAIFIILGIIMGAILMIVGIITISITLLVIGVIICIVIGVIPMIILDLIDKFD